jgi:hypothetical protein
MPRGICLVIEMSIPLFVDPFVHATSSSLFPTLASFVRSVNESAILNSAFLGEKARMEAKLETLAHVWLVETSAASSVADKMNNAAFREIVAIGKDAVPFLLSKLLSDPGEWIVALHTITGADPVQESHRGYLNEMTKDWLTWGRKSGYVR